MLRAIFLLAVLSITFVSRPVFAQTRAPADVKHSTSMPQALPRAVFAHYMVCYFNSLEFYKQEIELAQRHGIDGFALNCGQWASRDAKTGQWTPENYTLACERIYEAAKQLNSGFKLFISADINGLGNPDKLEDMVKRFREHPNQFRVGEKVALSSWGGSPEFFGPVLDRLANENLGVCFVPFFYSPKWAMVWSPETVQRFFDGSPRIDGIFQFGSDGSLGDVLRSNANARRVAMMRNKLCMAGLTPAYNSANLRDWRGMQGYGTAWRGIVRDNPEFVEIVTWSDYNEDSNLNPFRWPAGAEKQYISRDESFLDVTGYYSAWFKTGTQPAITQDRVFLTYRNRSRWNQRGWDEKSKQWVDATAKEWPYDQMHDDVSDFVYLDTFLTGAATLTVELGGREQKFIMPAGIGHAEVALEPGVPRVTLARDGKPLATFNGRKEIVGPPTEENSRIGYHLMNRTWTSGAAVGPVTRFEAESGALAGGAELVKVASVSAVKNAEADGSGFTLPMKGLKTATYNVRVTYTNPTKSEVRLTMLADGPPRAEKEHPYYLPVFLPPTGEGKFATTSVLWSLYENTTKLTVAWRKAIDGKAENNDAGSAMIDAVELVRVEPVAMPTHVDPTFPEMVSIPAGEFEMGSKDGNPDERPLHKVSVSAFRLGKYEVTNEQYERFDPSHRKVRDGFSWRDREPVIYVSWEDAVKYCNWLSEQAKLTPAYKEATDEKTKQKQWQFDASATGYRLPTEAQWEYAASGRGESRRYPWGAEAPDAGGIMRCHAAGKEALRMDLLLPATQPEGTIVVGSYPAGASRDGVMDLAGNVAEWCSDFYHPYTPDAAKDPCVQTPSNYRVMRGGSWGWYNASQRVADREYNNPKYPGFAYVGFRVALPAK